MSKRLCATSNVRNFFFSVSLCFPKRRSPFALFLSVPEPKLYIWLRFMKFRLCLRLQLLPVIKPFFTPKINTIVKKVGKDLTSYRQVDCFFYRYYTLVIGKQNLMYGTPVSDLELDLKEHSGSGQVSAHCSSSSSSRRQLFFFGFSLYLPFVFTNQRGPIFQYGRFYCTVHHSIPTVDPWNYSEVFLFQPRQRRCF